MWNKIKKVLKEWRVNDASTVPVYAKNLKPGMVLSPFNGGMGVRRAGETVAGVGVGMECGRPTIFVRTRLHPGVWPLHPDQRINVVISSVPVDTVLTSLVN